jgi:hypothetical protein
VLLENYQSYSSVGADEDSDQEVGGDAGSRRGASNATKPGRKTRATTSKQSSSRAAAKVKVAKTVKLEADKKKRKRRASPPPVMPTPATREVKERDEATDDPSVTNERAKRMSLSPGAKR